MRGLLSLILLFPSLALAQPAPSEGDIELAKAHFRTGEIYYEQGRYPDAAHEFEEAYRLSHRPALLYNMGKSYDGAGDAARALGAYRRFLAQVTGSADRPAVTERVEQLAHIVGHIQIASTVPGALVRVDGAEVGTTPLPAAVELNPGAHAVEVAHEGYATFKQSVVAAPGASASVDAKLESLVKVIRVEVPADRPPPTPLYKRWWLWTAVGAVVAAGVVTAAVLGSREPGVEGPSAQLPSVKTP
jgi:tetratricopeptide (TPR) repeat protein